MSEQATPELDVKEAGLPATAAENAQTSDGSNSEDVRVATEVIAGVVHVEAGKGSVPQTLDPAPSIPGTLSLYPGFSARKAIRTIANPPGGQISSWRVSCSRVSNSDRILRMPLSAMGIGFGENERTKHARILVPPQILRDAHPKRYFPLVRRRSDGGDDTDVEGTRNPLNNSTHRRMLAQSFIAVKQHSTASVPVEFPETTVIEPGRLPTWEEQRRIRLARGTAIATVKTVIAPATDEKRENHIPCPSRNLVAIEREDRREETTKADSEQKDLPLPIPLTAKSLTGGTPITRTDSELLCTRQA
ncbi:hypothetical protein QFC19_007416 [Naganishia cerealis]|uniref:Uncharacterized protein n=1 Tax=Naganishia cerealis TaxID=610337 RepID=A0ACC2VA01_9TREE|nr:hypothetical protein QFC19_007416 [Naganishia cerealis]